MQIGFVSLGMGRSSLADALAVAQRAGCECMELNGRATVHQNLWAEPIDYEAIGEQIRASGVRATSLGGYSDFAQPTEDGLAQQVEQFVGYCRVARTMGIPLVRVFAGDLVEGHDLDDLYPQLVKGFKALTEQVSGWGIKIGIENHGHLINDGDALHALISDVGSPLLGMTLDTGNFCWHGHSIETAHRFFERLAPMVVNVHIKDGKFVDGQWTLFPAGRGDIDLPALLTLLREQGYAGPVLSEYEGQADFCQSTIESVAYLCGLRDGLLR